MALERPDFFILGAPKCGTTALASYLEDHPGVLMARPKEPGYFCREFAWASRWQAEHGAELDDDAYAAACFGHAGNGAYAAVGDATVWHLFSREAVPRILDYAPRARCIVMLRNPADMLHSLHAHYVHMGQQPRVDFRDAWDAPAARAGDDRPSWLDPRLMAYHEVGALGEQVGRLLALLPPERLLVVLHDDLAREPLATWRAVLDFLGLPDTGRTRFPRQNGSRYVGNGLVLRLARSAPIRAGADAAKRAFGLRSLGIGRPAARPRPEDRRMVLDHFAPDIADLGRLIGRDLGHWTAS